MRLRIGANLGHVTIVPCVDVGLEAAVAIAALGSLRKEAVILNGHRNLGLLRGGPDMEPNRPVQIRRSCRACRHRRFWPDGQTCRGRGSLLLLRKLLQGTHQDLLQFQGTSFGLRRKLGKYCGLRKRHFPRRLPRCRLLW